MRCGRDCYSNSTERRTVQEKNNNGVEAKSLLDFFLFCVFGTVVNNSLEDFGISDLFDLNNVNAWTPAVC